MYQVFNVVELNFFLKSRGNFLKYLWKYKQIKLNENIREITFI